MAEPRDLLLPLLRETRAEALASREEALKGFAALVARFDRLERRFDTLREAVNGESVLGRYAAADVGDRLSSLEAQR
ncbi:hypothetical protein [uncultured Methylobacterium sp.]|uniref:hypothetical protein n=1 Tax=uncultured Methylobacterium sp. TaxID=157278 RepID=UPI00262BF36A|nr:hypothetical protein [uncultured Methylobacterium sp.]